jgi:hypothetical protein
MLLFSIFSAFGLLVHVLDIKLRYKISIALALFTILCVKVCVISSNQDVISIGENIFYKVAFVILTLTVVVDLAMIVIKDQES